MTRAFNAAARLVSAVPPDLGAALALVSGVAALRPRLSPSEVNRLRVLAYREVGLVSRRVHRASGRSLSIYDSHRGFDVDEGGRWATVCDVHATVAYVETRRHAESLGPESFCDYCRGIEEFRE